MAAPDSSRIQAPSKEDLVARAVEIFAKEFPGRAPTNASFAPGRVNLIGEHTDYQQGYVFPMALPNVAVVVGAENGMNETYVYSESVSSDNMLMIPDRTVTILERGPISWANYIKGIIHFFPSEVPDFDAVLVSSVPMGAGVSSSAAIEVAMFTFLEALTGTKVDKKEKVLLCQKCEHVFAQMPCGIMDQYIATFGEEGFALLLDCKSITHTQVSFSDKDVCILISNSNTKHQLDGSEYLSRATQCKYACTLMGIPSLREGSTAMLEKYRPKMDDLTFRRARHVITENIRTHDAAQALRMNDYVTFGNLMCQSHNSLRDDFEVSTEPLDCLVDLAMKCEGVYGARLTGAGFGGSTVTLVKSTEVDNVIETIRNSYPNKVDFLVAQPSTGAGNLTPLLQEILKKRPLCNKKSTMTQTKSLVK